MLFRQAEISRIEEILRQIVGKPFSQAKSVIEQRIEELLEQYGSTFLSPETKQILVIGYYRAAQEYKIAGPRKLGGPYFLHPEQTVAVLLDAGITDPVTLLAGLLHDVVEERLSAFYKELARKKVKYNIRTEREKKLIAQEVKNLQQRLATDLMQHSVSEADVLAMHVCEVVQSLTRRKKELYYSSIKRLFDPPQLVCAENASRAIIVKFADRCANTLDLERADYTVYPAHIKLQDIIDAYTQHNPKRITELCAQTREYAAEHPMKQEGKFSGDQKLHPCFKNIILMNQYREWVLAGNASLGAVEAMDLPGITLRTTQKIIDHLCTYHCGNGTLNPQIVFNLYEEHERYKHSGGYACVTRAHSSYQGYDGIVQRFFHAKIRGNTEALAELYNNRALMFRAAIGFNNLCFLYQTDPLFHLRGLTSSGVHAEAPVSYKK
jgi:hypothetical protein